jgi:hypothetical protein
VIQADTVFGLHRFFLCGPSGFEESSSAACQAESKAHERNKMVDIILLLMVIASAVSLIVVNPRDLQRKAILALREYEKMELSHTLDRSEDGQSREIPLNNPSGSHPLS